MRSKMCGCSPLIFFCVQNMIPCRRVLWMALWFRFRVCFGFASTPSSQRRQATRAVQTRIHPPTLLLRTSAALFIRFQEHPVSAPFLFLFPSHPASVRLPVSFCLPQKPSFSSAAVSSAPEEEPVSGDTWYSQQAFRAINQAVGRVIRHRGDHGSVIFADARFAGANSMPRQSLCRWMRSWVQE